MKKLLVLVVVAALAALAYRALTVEVPVDRP